MNVFSLSPGLSRRGQGGDLAAFAAVRAYRLECQQVLWAERNLLDRLRGTSEARPEVTRWTVAAAKRNTERAIRHWARQKDAPEPAVYAAALWREERAGLLPADLEPALVLHRRIVVAWIRHTPRGTLLAFREVRAPWLRHLLVAWAGQARPRRGRSLARKRCTCADA